jgi:hypothetical protein
MNMAYLLSKLDEDTLRTRVPSIFARHAHTSRSERYAFTPTIDVVRALGEHGFVPVSAAQNSTKDWTRKEYTRHSVTLRRESDVTLWEAKTRGEVIPELRLLGSHDGTTAHTLFAGMFRVVCLNGMVTAESSVPSVHVRHSGKALERLIAGAYAIAEQTALLQSVVDAWRVRILARAEIEAFAAEAHALRFPVNADGEVSTPVHPEALLKTRRHDDVGASLWRVFNRVQENMLRGGVSGYRHDPKTGKMRRTTTRDVKAITSDLALNRGVWSIAEKFAAA